MNLSMKGTFNINYRAIITLEANEVINTLSTPGRTSFISPPKQANNQNNGAGSSFSQVIKRIKF